MGETTKIEWTDHTFNPWRGCEHARLPDGSQHPGCLHCYAEAQARRFPELLGVWGAEGTRVLAPEKYWAQAHTWNKRAEKEGVRRRVFCASIADVFEDWRGPIVDPTGQLYFVNDQGEKYRCKGLQPSHLTPPLSLNTVRAELFKLIDATPWLDWLLLTKRPQNVRRMLAQTFGMEPLTRGPDGVFREPGMMAHLPARRRENVWIGTSVSDQASANAVLPELLKLRDLTPVLFVSAEPLVGPINFRWQDYFHRATGETYREYLHRTGVVDQFESLKGLDWIIVGGESGQQARVCSIDHVQWIVDQCRAAGTACFVKQLGSNPRGHCKDGERAERYIFDRKGGEIAEWPESLRVREFPKVEVPA